ncbi:threonine synthase-like 1 isoform X2 [Corythoichthys intestinalis]|nr:threonine synthase-like 1 isoform X2 [Corythoichthys intestinalis]
MALLRSRPLAQRAFRCSLALKSWLSTHTSTAGYLKGKNILIMGAPGAGKTTVGRIVAHKLGLPAVDVDDDVLETTWKMPVAAKLAAVGGERFLQEEGQVLCNFSASGCVVSLTGSNPLHPEAMRHVKQSGTVVYLDVDGGDILQRLHRMKVDRIVGQEAGQSFSDILKYRKQFYEQWLDIRVLCGRGDTPEEMAEKVLQAVERFYNLTAETFVSTRADGEERKTYFSDVVVEGLAPDGGLYVPKNGFSKIAPREWLRLVDMSYPERALVLLEKCIHPLEVSAVDLREMVSKAYGSSFSNEDVVPVKRLMDDMYIQELFHGPTASFKDLALQLMPQLFAYCLPPMCNYLILVATSGDTGSAVLSGFGRLRDEDRRKTAVLVFFPEDGVSRIQKLQMTSLSRSHAKAVSVRSDFDFCQRSIKRMFGEAGLTGHLAVEFGTVLSTANSINWARLLPQVVYHSATYLNLCRSGAIQFGDPVDLCIPTGNFGNAMSAVYAKQMGVPIRKVICASNCNRAVSDFINTGEYDLRERRLMPSCSPAIDILKSSNLERFVHHVSGGDGALVKDMFSSLDARRRFTLPDSLLGRMRRDVRAGWCSEQDCLAAIYHVHARSGYILDTHAAVAKVVADRQRDRTCPVVISATAHYGKFAPAVFEALRVENIPDNPLEQLKRLDFAASKPEKHQKLMECLKNRNGREHAVCEADYSVLVEHVEAMIEESFLKVMET